MRRVLLALAVIIVVGLLLSGCTTEEASVPEPITLSIVMAWSSGEVNDKTLEWVDKVNAESNGRVTIEYRGGPEAVPQAEQFPSLQSGVIDILYTAGAYYANIIPAATALNCSLLDPVEEREVGFADLMDKIYREQGNVVYLARMAGVSPVTYYWTNFPFTSLEQFKGKKFRSSWSNEPLLEEMGAVGVSLTVGQIYTSMERHLIDGFNQPIMGSIPRGYHEVATHIIDIGMQQLPNAVLINLSSWNNLPKDMQDLLMETALEVEATVGDYYLGLHNADYKTLKDEKGMIFVDLPEEEAKWLVERSSEIYWDRILKDDPVNGPRLKELVGVKK